MYFPVFFSRLFCSISTKFRKEHLDKRVKQVGYFKLSGDVSGNWIFENLDKFSRNVFQSHLFLVSSHTVHANPRLPLPTFTDGDAYCLPDTAHVD